MLINFFTCGGSFLQAGTIRANPGSFLPEFCESICVHLADLTKWGVDLCEATGVEEFKLLYDIYHMQIMEGDVIATIRKFHSYFAHYHTGGVPGRHEIDNTQELYYPAIMEAIVETGYDGYVAQEFIPAGPDPLNSLKEGVHICDV